MQSGRVNFGVIQFWAQEVRILLRKVTLAACFGCAQHGCVTLWMDKIRLSVRIDTVNISPSVMRWPSKLVQKIVYQYHQDLDDEEILSTEGFGCCWIFNLSFLVCYLKKSWKMSIRHGIKTKQASQSCRSHLRQSYPTLGKGYKG